MCYTCASTPPSIHQTHDDDYTKTSVDLCMHKFMRSIAHKHRTAQPAAVFVCNASAKIHTHTQTHRHYYATICSYMLSYAALCSRRRRRLTLYRLASLHFSIVLKLRMATGVLCDAVSRRAAVGCCCCCCSSDKRVYHVREYVSTASMNDADDDDDDDAMHALVFLWVYALVFLCLCCASGEMPDTQANMTAATPMAGIIVLRVRGIAYIAWSFHESVTTLVLAS